VGDLVVLHGLHLLGPQRCHCNRFAVERHELDFVKFLSGKNTALRSVAVSPVARPATVVCDCNNRDRVAVDEKNEPIGESLHPGLPMDSVDQSKPSGLAGDALHRVRHGSGKMKSR